MAEIWAYNKYADEGNRLRCNYTEHDARNFAETLGGVIYFFKETPVTRVARKTILVEGKLDRQSNTLIMPGAVVGSFFSGNRFVGAASDFRRDVETGEITAEITLQDDVPTALLEMDMVWSMGGVEFQHVHLEGDNPGVLRIVTKGAIREVAFDSTNRRVARQFDVTSRRCRSL